MVVDLIAVVHLRGVELALASDGIGAVYALDGALFVLIGVSPWYWPGPVEIGLDGVSLSVLPSILKASLPPNAGSARRSRMIESRTQNTNCLYFELVTSVSSIQKESMLTPRALLRMHGRRRSPDPWLWSRGPRAPCRRGRARRTMLRPLPVTSPPLVPRARLGGGEDPDGHRNGAQQCRRRPELHVSGICFADFIICIIVATLFEWNGVYSCFSLRS